VPFRRADQPVAPLGPTARSAKDVAEAVSQLKKATIDHVLANGLPILGLTAVHVGRPTDSGGWVCRGWKCGAAFRTHHYTVHELGLLELGHSVG
jgi:hypothetical protein